MLRAIKSLLVGSVIEVAEVCASHDLSPDPCIGQKEQKGLFQQPFFRRNTEVRKKLEQHVKDSASQILSCLYILTKLYNTKISFFSK
jgi:hypothetical protein